MSFAGGRDLPREYEGNSLCGTMASSPQEEGAGLQPKVPQLIAEYDGRGSDAYAALRRMEKYDSVDDADRVREHTVVSESGCREGNAYVGSRCA